VLALPDDERAMIADRLWDSLSTDARDELADPTDDPAFRAQLDRRLASVAVGTAELLEPADVFARVREHLRRKRGA
jgi:putative addiction module component (TIGR02574 family)